MIFKLPNESKRHSIVSGSDLFGSISYGKNINLDEPGYIKLAHRTVSLFNQADDSSNIRLPVAFGRGTLFTSPEDSIDYTIAQNAIQGGWWLTLLVDSITLNADSDASRPIFTTDSHGAWFKNLWHVTDDDDLFSKAGIADTNVYTEITDGTPANLTAGKVHFIEPFEDLAKLAVTNGNTVVLYSESGGTYTLDVTLTLPSDFEAIALSYSNGSMGILTMLSDTATGKNQNKQAQFFVWDGVGTSAQPGIPIGSSKGIAVAPYRGSWVILNSLGQLRYYNGGGWDAEFEKSAALPFYFKDLAWGNSYSRDLLGDIMWVEGDLIYININGLLRPYGERYEQFLGNAPGGILCYDPAVGGVYQRYSPSLTRATHIQVAQADVNTSTDIMTKTAAGSSDMNDDIPPTGSPIKLVEDKTSTVGGVTPNKIYYVIKHTATTFSLATSEANATAGTKVDLTSQGATDNYFYGIEVRDFGASYANQVGAIADIGTVHPMWDHLLFGSEINDYDGTGNSVHYNVTVPDFENRGYYVTPKMQSVQVQDTGQKVYVKYRTLKADDSIIVKVKDKDILGVPVSTPQATASAVNQCSWTSSTVFTTTANLADAKTAFDDGVDLECEVIAGAGAGCLEKISNLTETGGTYTVTLAVAVDGAASGRRCDVLIENWRVLGTITSADVSGYKQFLVDSTSTWFKFKVEMRGTDIAVEEVQFVNATHKPSV